MKELKFTPENLERHLKAYYNIWDYCSKVLPNVYEDDRLTLYTTRDEPKGKLGDVFQIDQLGYFVLDSLTPVYSRGDMSAIDIVSDRYCLAEGFGTPKSMKDELKRIYGEPTALWVHHLKQVFL